MTNRIGGAPQQPVKTQATKPPTRVGQAGPTSPPAAPKKRSSRFDTVAPPKPPPPEPFLELGKNPAGAQGTQTMPSKTGPIPAGMWKNPAELVSNLRQDTGAPGDVSGDDRCGPTNLLASRLLTGGSKAAADFLAAEAKSPNLSPAEQKRLTELSKAVRSETATFDHLNEATTLLYKAGNTRTSLTQFVHDPAIANASLDKLGPAANTLRTLLGKATSDPKHFSAGEAKQLSELLTKLTGKETKVSISVDPRNPKNSFAQVAVTSADHSGLDDGELSQFAKAGGLKSSGGAINVKGVDEGYDVTNMMLEKLKPGESMVLRVGLTGGDESPNHFITIGRMKDGRPFIYNPSPQGGDATLVLGKAKGEQTEQFTGITDAIDRRIKRDDDGAIPRTLTVK